MNTCVLEALADATTTMVTKLEAERAEARAIARHWHDVAMRLGAGRYGQPGQWQDDYDRMMKWPSERSV